MREIKVWHPFPVKMALPFYGGGVNLASEEVCVLLLCLEKWDYLMRKDILLPVVSVKSKEINCNTHWHTWVINFLYVAFLSSSLRLILFCEVTNRGWVFFSFLGICLMYSLLLLLQIALQWSLLIWLKPHCSCSRLNLYFHEAVVRGKVAEVAPEGVLGFASPNPQQTTNSSLIESSNFWLYSNSTWPSSIVDVWRIYTLIYCCLILEQMEICFYFAIMTRWFMLTFVLYREEGGDRLLSVKLIKTTAV